MGGRQLANEKQRRKIPEKGATFFSEEMNSGNSKQSSYREERLQKVRKERISGEDDKQGTRTEW